MVIKTKEGGILDTYKTIKYPFNYSIGDVRDVTKRNIDYSKTIKLPSSKNNNKYFEMFFNVNIKSGAFNPNEKRFISVEENGSVVFEGYIQLMSVVINGDLSYYEAVVFSSFRNILDVIEGVNLNDLDFSEYNHIYEQNTFKLTCFSNRYNYVYSDEWTKSIGYGIYTIASLGYGYVYPYISYDGTIQDFTPNYSEPQLFPNAYPSFFVREYIDKIFLLAGFKVESKFFETEYFKSLILPFTNGEMGFTDEDIEASEMLYENTSQVLYGTEPSYGESIYQISNPEKVKDAVPPLNNNNGISYSYTSGAKRINRIKGTLKLVFDYYQYIPQASKITSDTFEEGNVQIRVLVQGELVHTEDLISISELPYSADDLTNGNEFEKEIDFEIPESVVINKGDEVIYLLYIKNEIYGWRLGAGQAYATTDIYFNDSSISSILSSDAVVSIGDYLSVNKAIPKIKTTEFLKSIITMFNLYIYQKNEGTMMIETRDEFYNQGEILFYDDRLDKSKEIRIKTLSEESAKIYEYKYKDSNDYIVKEYKEDNDGNTYAEKRVITDNQFLTNTQGYTTTFAPTGTTTIQFTELDANGDYVKSEGDAEVPVFYGRELKENVLSSSPNYDDYIYSREKSPPRILFYNNSGIVGTTEKQNYPDFSLDFQSMASGDWIPYYDLYNLFHKNTIEEVSSSDAKMMTCYLRFNKNELSIRDKLYILGDYWRINKIIDYNANSNESTKVELFKINDKTNYLTAERVIEQNETKQGQYNNKYNNKFS